MKKSFGEKLKQARNDKKLKQSELAKQLGVTNTTVSNWENNISKPDLDMLSYICGALEVKVSYFLEAKLPEGEISISEFDIIKKYRALDPDGQSHVNAVLGWETTRVTALSERDDRIKTLETEQVSCSIPRRIFAYYGKIAAAGTWVDFSDLIAGTKEYYLTNENANADYTIGVNGDSMEPTYCDGDIVFVKTANHLNVGDIGIFQKDNCIYIKEVGENGLISHKQEKYPPMINGGDVRCWGKVVGKVTEDMIITN